MNIYSTSAGIDPATITGTTNTNNEGLWTVADLMAYAQISRATVFRLMKLDRLHGVKLGHQWRFDPAQARRELMSGISSITPAYESSKA